MVEDREVHVRMHIFYCKIFIYGHNLIGWLVALRIYVALVIFQPYRDLEARENQSLKS